MRRLKSFSKALVFFLAFLLLPLGGIYSEDLTEIPTAELLEELETILNEREQSLNERESLLQQKEELLSQREQLLNEKEDSLNERKNLINDQETYFKNLKEDSWIDKLTWFGIGTLSGFVVGNFTGFKIGVSISL